MLRSISLCLSFVLSHSFAADLTIMVGDNPPFNSFRNSIPEGMAVDIVNEMLKRSEIQFSYASYPWVRIFNLAQTQINHCAYTVGRLPERENSFLWIGPIAFNQWAFFALRNRRLIINNIDDARKYIIGGQRKEAKATWLETRGFQIDYATEERQTFQKLMSNRIDLYPAGLFSVGDLAERYQVDPQQLQPIFVFNRSELYLACNPRTDKDLIEKLQKAFESIKIDKTINKIWLKYEDKFKTH